MTRPEPQVIVVFGARGDLARRKLLPGLLRLERAGLLPEDYRVIGSGRREPDGPWAEEVRSRLADDGADVGDGAWERFGGRLTFAPSSAEDGEALAAAVRAARDALGGDAGVVLYLSVPPSAMQPMVGMLGATGLADDPARVVMEKPFGRDAASARALNDALHEHFPEDRIFRIDHFLGKEAVQGILALRLANGVFEPVWNRDHIASVQIDVPEALDLEGRAGFYEETGAFRDMVVTHLSQVLGFIAMDRPESLDAEALQDAKAAVFADLRRFDPGQAVFGQYEGFRDEDGIDPASRTETFVALRAEIDADRWRGVPFLLRTGKAMAAGRRVLTVTFRDPDVLVPPAGDGDGAPDVLVMDLSEDPKIALELRVKRPGPRLVAARARMELDVEAALDAEGLEAYERLLLDVMRGDHLLFTRADEIEMLWERSADLLASPPEPLPYARGGWGPQEALDLAGPAGWRLPEEG